ncbi:MAG: misacylated tRNA(Ala) deacylase, partial [Candidatus Azotimanducaceae bacterium]
MSEMLFRHDSYQREAQAKVIAHTMEGGVVLDGSIFYPKGGGQPGDSGHLRWDTQTMSIAT